jgi:hypothetical protein
MTSLVVDGLPRAGVVVPGSLPFDEQLRRLEQPVHAPLRVSVPGA